MYQFLPLILESISSEKKIWYRNKNLKTSYLIDIVHSLILKYYFKKVNQFNLSSSIMRMRYGKDYNFYINYLLDNKVIELVKNYYIGSHSRIYRLTDSVLKNEMKRYNNYDKILLKKEKNEIIRKNNEEESPINPILRKKLISDLFFVGIDYDLSLKYLDTIEDKEIFLKNKYSIDCIKNKTIFYQFDSYGRFHTNFTILKSHIRKNYLTINDEEVCECDIPSSQPLFLTKLIQENNFNVVDIQEFYKFARLTYGGKFYSYIMENSEFKDKKSVKEMVYKSLFGRNNENKYNNVFSMLFPTIYKFIKMYKDDHENYKMLSHELQRLESKFMFNSFIKEIYNKIEDINLITIHDSIVFPSKYKILVEEIFEEKMDEEFSFLKKSKEFEKIIFSS